MFYIKSFYGFYMNIPISYSIRNRIKQRPALNTFLYDNGHQLFVDNIRHFFTFEQYYAQPPELLMRGFILSSELMEKAEQWHFFEVDEKVETSTTLSESLLALHPFLYSFKQLIKDKPNSFFNFTPIECIEQFFPTIKAKQVKRLFLKHGKLFSCEYYHKAMMTCIFYLPFSNSLIERLKQHRLFFIEDIMENTCIPMYLFQLKEMKLIFSIFQKLEKTIEFQNESVYLNKGQNLVNAGDWK